MAGGYPPQQQPQGYQQPPQGYAQPGQAPMVDPNAPYGVDPKTGIPYSDKQKMIAAILQIAPIVIFFGGIGRLYTGHVGTGVAQLLLSFCGVGGLWSIIDGIMILVNDSPLDANGRVLKP